MGKESRFSRKHTLNLELRRLKLPLTRAARGDFGYALTVARLTFRTAFAHEFLYYIASELGVSVATYEGYESGSASVNEGVLAKLLRIYRDSDDICEGLIEAYKLEYGEVAFLSGRTFIHYLSEVNPETVEQNIDFVRIQAEMQYNFGSLASAYRWSHLAWNIAMTNQNYDKAVSMLAITHARIASGRGDHRTALEVLEKAISFTQWGEEPAVRATLETSLSAAKVRRARHEGTRAASEFGKCIKLMRHRTANPMYSRDTGWGWVWYDAQRSAIISLCDTFAQDDKRQIRALLPELHSFASNTPELGFVYESTASRILAVMQDPDLALQEIERLQTRSVQTFADECYHAKSRILATFRQGAKNRDYAISESDYYAQRCAEKQLFHKQEGFILLSNRLRRYVEQKIYQD